MSQQAAVQQDFARAARDPSLAAPAALAASGDARPERRFAVYRNNVAVGLIGAIEARFPAVRRIVGDAFFVGLARDFVAAHPPRSPLMMTYGDAFPDFVRIREGLDELPYLADVARLEAARTRAYHAADAEPLDPQALAAIDPGRLDRLRFELHPSFEVVRSTHPIVTIWAMNAGDAGISPIDDWRGEDALVARPELEVQVRRLPEGGADLVQALAAGRELGEAAGTAAEAAESFDLTLNLTVLLQAGLLVRAENPLED